MTKWSVKERAMEAMSHKLDQGGMVMSDWFSDKLCTRNTDLLTTVKNQFEYA